jgi:hypothetical protein
MKEELQKSVLKTSWAEAGSTSCGSQQMRRLAPSDSARMLELAIAWNRFAYPLSGKSRT